MKLKQILKLGILAVIITAIAGIYPVAITNASTLNVISDNVYIAGVLSGDTPTSTNSKISGHGLQSPGRDSYNGLSNEGDLDQFIVGITNFVLSFVTAIAMIMLLYGGYLWIIDMGEDQQPEKAKKIIAGSVIGILVIISAYTIVNTVLDFYASNDECSIALSKGDTLEIEIFCDIVKNTTIQAGTGAGGWVSGIFGF